MNYFNKRIFSCLSVLVLSFSITNVYAACTSKIFRGGGLLGGGSSSDYKSNMMASLGIGRISITSAYLQPFGTTLATGLTNYNTISMGNLSTIGPDGVIASCDSEDDVNNLKWVYATNGDSIIGGYYQIENGSGFYGTNFPYVALKLTFVETGEVFSRLWQESTQKVKRTYDDVTGKWVVKKKDIPQVYAELQKWRRQSTDNNAYDGYTGYGSTKTSPGFQTGAYYTQDDGVRKQYKSVGNTWCRAPDYGYDKETAIPNHVTETGTIWSSDYQDFKDSSGANVVSGCGQPNAYILLSTVGTGSTNIPIGSDSNASFSGFAWANGVAIGLGGRPPATFTYAPSCIVRTVTPYVLFPTMSVTELTNGDTRTQDVNISVECDNTLTVTDSATSVLVGFKPSISAFNNATNLGFVNNEGNSHWTGVQYLVSDNYTDDTMAKGVGISLMNSFNEKLNFISWTRCDLSSAACPSFSSINEAQSAGYDPLARGASIQVNEANSTRIYTKTYKATLSKLPGIDVTPGKIKATATVKVQVP